MGDGSGMETQGWTVSVNPGHAVIMDMFGEDLSPAGRAWVSGDGVDEILLIISVLYLFYYCGAQRTNRHIFY
jgi:hypothetical protein